MSLPDDRGKVGDALLVAGYDMSDTGTDDPRLPLVTQLGEALLASTSPWRIRRLAAHGGERDLPTRGNLRREIDALLARPAAVRIVVIAAALTRTVEGLAVVCVPTLDGFREDASVPLEWIAVRVRRAASVPTALVVAVPGDPRDARAGLDALGSDAGEHVIAVDAGDPVATLRCLRDGLWSEAVDLATGTVTLRSLGDHLGRHRGAAAIQPSSSTTTVLSPRGLVRTDLAERASERPSEDVDELIGAVLPGRYRIVSELRRGGFGVVYRAHEELVDRDVAVKVLPAGLGVDAIRRFVHEIRAVGRLAHRNVVRVLHADVVRDGRMFAVMELVAGRTVEQLLEDGPIPAARALVLVRQLVAGLAAAHAAGIVHADVKPANAMVVDGADPRLVLLDFGLSRLRADALADPSGGTPLFMAPEQLRGRPIDASADVHAAALVALTLVTGAPPRTAAERARALAAFADERVRAALARSLADDPTARFASAVELAAALDDGASTASPPPARPPFRIAAPFTEEDRQDFHGRAADVERLLEHVLFRRAVVYVAPSGTGKTSLLRAGLVPRLRELEVDVVYLACRAGVAGNLAEVIAPGSASVAAAIERRAAEAPARRLVMIIDQIEALLVDRRDETRGGAVLEALGLPAWPLEAPVCVVWSVREEYLARLLDRVQRFEPGLPIVRLGPLGAAVAAEILTRTLAHRAIAIDPALLEELIRDLTGAAAGLAADLGWGDEAAVYPPHLQLAGTVLYEARAGQTIDLEVYRRAGGLATILAEHLYRVLEDELGDADTAIARDILLALVASDHTRVACEEPELLGRVRRDAAGRSEVVVIDVLHFLRDRGLVVATLGSAGEPLWDLAHDSLVVQIEAWVTATDLARRRALELVRYHLRRSRPGAPSRLGVAELRELRRHLRTGDLADLDQEWQARPSTGPRAASRLVAASRRARIHQVAAITGFGLIALAIAGALALRWRDERQLRRHEVTLRDRDIGSSVLVLRAFDWDPTTFTSTPATQVELSWTLVRPLSGEDDSPGAAFAPGDLSIRPVAPPPDAMRAAVVAARGGPAVLVVERRDRAGQPCSRVTLPIRRLPGHASPPQTLAVRVPTCEATRTGMITIPAGPFVAGGLGDPPAPYRPVDVPRESQPWLDEYAIDRTELSFALMHEFVAMREVHGISELTVPDTAQLKKADAPRRPAIGMTWQEARAVCRWLGRDLPTLDQWDKAFRGGSMINGKPNPCPRRSFVWCGGLEAGRANLRGEQVPGPAAVGTYDEDTSSYGVKDMVGNVSEWTGSPAIEYSAIPAVLDAIPTVRAVVQRIPHSFMATRGCNWSDVECMTAPLSVMAIPNPRARRTLYFGLGFRCAL